MLVRAIVLVVHLAACRARITDHERPPLLVFLVVLSTPRALITPPPIAPVVLLLILLFRALPVITADVRHHFLVYVKG